ncbi:MAG: alpha/beta fold hydrolase [Rhizobiales bacterium]|nr:alpha/beta fold hydrolase [Hyphomicrobiales bacterium]
MPVIDVNGTQIAYDVVGEGKPILLLHGFASTRIDNWRRTGWYDALVKAGRQVIAMDFRGHGESGKSHDPADYGTAKHAADALALLEHLGIERTELMGFSMGAGVAMYLAAHHADRIKLLVLLGVGGKSLKRSDNGEALASALLADDADDVEHEMARGFRLYAEKLGQDREALAASVRAPRDTDDMEAMVRSIKTETLIVAGSRDDLAGDPNELAELMGDAQGEIVPGADHMFILPNPVLKGIVVDFLMGWV